VKYDDSIRSCLSGIEEAPNRIRISQRSIEICHVRFWTHLEEVITNLKWVDVDCQILTPDKRAEIAQIRRGKMERSPDYGGEGYKVQTDGPESENERKYIAVSSSDQGGRMKDLRRSG